MAIHRLLGTPTADAGIFWDDVYEKNGWRVQYNSTLDSFLSPLKPYRLLDDSSRLLASGDSRRELIDEIHSELGETDDDARPSAEEARKEAKQREATTELEMLLSRYAAETDAVTLGEVQNAQSPEELAALAQRVMATTEQAEQDQTATDELEAQQQALDALRQRLG